MTFTAGGSGFQNPIVGGGGELVIDNIHSRDFETGVQGWQISRDGNAEFNDVTLRGVFFVRDGDNEVRISALNAPWTFDPAITLNPAVFDYAPAIIRARDTFANELQGTLDLYSPYPADPSGPTALGDPATIQLTSDVRNTLAGRRVDISADELAFDGNTSLSGNLLIGGTTFYDGDLIGLGDYVGQERMFRAFVNTTRNNSTTLQNISGLSAPVEPNAFYTFRCYLILVSPTATPDINIGFTAPAGATFAYTPLGLAFGATSDTDAVRLPQAVSQRRIAAMATETVALPHGYLLTGANGGNFNAQMSQAIATAENSQVLAGSHMIIKRWE